MGAGRTHTVADLLTLPRGAQLRRSRSRLGRSSIPCCLRDSQSRRALQDSRRVPLKPRLEFGHRDQHEPAAAHGSHVRHHVALERVDTHPDRVGSLGLRGSEPRWVTLLAHYSQDVLAHRSLPIAPKRLANSRSPHAAHRRRPSGHSPRSPGALHSSQTSPCLSGSVQVHSSRPSRAGSGSLWTEVRTPCGAAREASQGSARPLQKARGASRKRTQLRPWARRL